INEFMSQAPEADSVADSTASGVIMIPPLYDLTLQATMGKVRLNDLVLERVRGAVSVKDGEARIKEAGFGMIGCEVLMDAGYTGLSPSKAAFDYHIRAKDFDIRKAYDSVRIFRDL